MVHWPIETYIRSQGPFSTSRKYRKDPGNEIEGHHQSTSFPRPLSSRLTWNADPCRIGGLGAFINEGKEHYKVVISREWIFRWLPRSPRQPFTVSQEPWIMLPWFQNKYLLNLLKTSPLHHLVVVLFSFFLKVTVHCRQIKARCRIESCVQPFIMVMSPSILRRFLSHMLFFFRRSSLHSGRH